MSIVPSVLRSTSGTSTIPYVVQSAGGRFFKGFATSVGPSKPDFKTDQTNKQVPISNISSIETQLSELSEAIKSVEAEIKQTADDIRSTSDAEMRTFLIQTVGQLRTDKQQLRKKEEQLRAEKQHLAEKEVENSKPQQPKPSTSYFVLFLIPLFFTRVLSPSI